MPVVSNSSPLIGLEQIGQLDLLHSLFGEIFIPDGVAAEVSATVRLRPWIRKQSVLQPLLAETKTPALGVGEREAICLAVEMRASAIILDDEPARKAANKLNLRVIGTAGVVLAKERQLIGSVRSCLDALIDHRFYLSRALYELILSRVDELKDNER
jgi:predicted nucleic acid-binding protein